MDYVRQIVSSNELGSIFNLPPSLRDTTVEVIILPVKSNDEKKTKNKLKLGFLKGKVPKLPDSFFDPMPEDDLQAREGKYSR